jgi:hypothetical protein
MARLSGGDVEIRPLPFDLGSVLVQPGACTMTSRKSEPIEVENVNHPGHVQRVDGAKYAAMKAAFMKVLPAASPGMTVDDLRERVLAHLPGDLYPQGATAGWWVKAVQLDLEAKGVIVPARPGGEGRHRAREDATAASSAVGVTPTAEGRCHLPTNASRACLPR